jgi:hypothetical protein
MTFTEQEILDTAMDVIMEHKRIFKQKEKMLDRDWTMYGFVAIVVKHLKKKKEGEINPACETQA